MIGLRIAVALAAISLSSRAELHGQAATTQSDTLLVGGLKRSFSLYIPHTVADKPALVLAFHGSGGDARQPQIFGFEGLADSSGFLLAYPDGYERHWNDCRSAGPYSANTLDIDDVGFMRSLVAHLFDRYGVDTRSVFATGWSNGGQFAYRLALESPDLVAAVAPFCASLPVATNMDCIPADQPVSVMIVNGTEDLLSPWEGGPSSNGEVMSAEATFAYWVEVADLHGEPKVTGLPDVVSDDGSTVEQHSLSSGQVEVSLVIVRGGGHTFPGSSMRGGGRLGAVNRDVDGAEMIWRFFSRHLSRQ